jgi:murein DD-endopeptidase MepM/ murein hydrolase activator NlpD
LIGPKKIEYKDSINKNSSPVINYVARNKYQLPIPLSQVVKIDNHSSPAHAGKLENAVDFVTHENNIVLAAAGGTVTYVKDDSDIGGPSINFWYYSNFISIKHQNEEHTRYDHLACGSSKVRVGEMVTAGQEIAKVGMTGFTYLPHLHFQVFVFTGPNLWEDYQTLKVDF